MTLAETHLPLLVAAAVVGAVGCSCAPPPGTEDGGLDGALVADAGPTPDHAMPDAMIDDVVYPDTGVCAPDEAPAVVCDGASRMSCQTWAEGRLPSWDVVATLTCIGTPQCGRGDHFRYIDGGPGIDAGQAFDYLDGSPLGCGDGPVCAPGFQCARRLGDPTVPRTCICTNPG